MNLSDVNRGIQKHKKRKRVGRGPGLGTRQDQRPRPQGPGAVGRLDRAADLRGGASPLVRRIPKRGFHNAFAETVVSRQCGRPERGVRSRRRSHARVAARKRPGRADASTRLKILGDGELTKKLKISAHRFSATALEKIEQAGGEAIVLPRPKAERPRQRRKPRTRRRKSK